MAAGGGEFGGDELVDASGCSSGSALCGFVAQGVGQCLDGVAALDCEAAVVDQGVEFAQSDGLAVSA